MTISGNSLLVAGNGIRCAADGVWIGDNKSSTLASGRDASIAIELTAGLDKDGTNQCHILANQIGGFGSAGIVVNAPVRDLIIKLNIIENCGNGIVSINAGSDGALSIENNHLRNINALTEGSKDRVMGIFVERAGSATIAGNTLRGLGALSVQSGLRAGILALSVARVRAFGNQILELGPAGDFIGQTAGIMLRGPLIGFEVGQNLVGPMADTSNGRGGGDWAALVVLDVDLEEPALAGRETDRGAARRRQRAGAGCRSTASCHISRCGAYRGGVRRQRLDSRQRVQCPRRFADGRG